MRNLQSFPNVWSAERFAIKANARAKSDDPRSAFLRVALYLFVPLVVGMLLGWQRPGRTADVGLLVAVAYWSVLCLSSWWAVTLCCRAIASRLRHFGFWAVIVGGWLITLPISYVVGAGVSNMMILLVPQLAATFPPPVFLPSLSQGWQGVLEDGLPGMIVWVAAHALFHIGFGLTVFGIQPRNVIKLEKDGAARENREPPFMAKVPPEARGEIISVQAELHYTRIYTESSDALILYQFGDVVKELEPVNGLRVHRSWWVRTDAVTNIERSGNKYRINLKNGMSVPLSRTYLQVARTTGLLHE